MQPGKRCFSCLKSKRNASEWTLEGRRESHKSNFEKQNYSEIKPKQLQGVQESFGTQCAQLFFFTSPASSVLAPCGAPKCTVLVVAYSITHHFDVFGNIFLGNLQCPQSVMENIPDPPWHWNAEVLLGCYRACPYDNAVCNPSMT